MIEFQAQPDKKDMIAGTINVNPVLGQASKYSRGQNPKIPKEAFANLPSKILLKERPGPRPTWAHGFSLSNALLGRRLF